MDTVILASRLMAYAIDSVEPQLEKDLKIDYQSLFSLSKAHSMANVVGYALEKLGLMPPQFAPLFKKESLLEMARTSAQETAICELSSVLQCNSIRFMLLKGCVLRQLCPTPDMRPMCDIDIQYDTEKIAEVERIMLSLGYEKSTVGGTGGVNVSYKKPPFLNIEFHGVLMDTDIPIYNRYFGTGFGKAVAADGFEMKYTDENFFVFMAAHTAKHYFHGGTGLRSVMDMWLYLRKKPQLDMDYVYTELKKIRLDEFVKTLLGVSAVLFDGAEPNAGQAEIISYIADSGTYGTNQHDAASGADEESKASFLLKRLFPPLDFMSINYPTVERLPFLLPLFWVIRLISALLGKKAKGSDVSLVLSMPASSLDARKIAGNPFIE